MPNPYRGAADRQFWSRAVTWPAPGMIDPVSRSARILTTDRVATFGSCFAQHIARHLAASGGHYFVPESAPQGMTPEEAHRRNYGVFSARYGNVYTVQQALQLVRRAWGEFRPQTAVWQRGDRLVDPFRPRIEPDGFTSEQALETDREAHLRCVREVFGASDWLVFTLGLTEAWRDRRDGAVFPLAPGVDGGEYDPTIHEFVNFGIDEVRDQLFELILAIGQVNPRCRIILTVSPVPLIATFEPRHVLVSTAVSKAVLRVAADEAERRFPQVLYFPSYEIVTSPATQGLYYADDLREVTPLGVGHVMRIFSRHFLADPAGAVTSTMPPPVYAPSAQGVICDEETIERSIAAYRRGA